MKIQQTDISKVHPYPGNPRINDDAANKVAESIKEYGWNQPVVVDKDFVVVAGHTRLKAAKILGLAKVPVYVAADLTPEQVKAYRLADNRTAEEASWDNTLLATELASLMEVDFNLALTGFDEDELAVILAKAASTNTDAKDDCPDIQEECVSELGDIWQLGNHRVMCGDSTDLASVKVLCENQQVDLLLTDPPYNVDYEGKTAAKLKIENDHKSDSEFLQFLVDAFSTAFAVMKPGACFYVWHADSEGFNFRYAATQAGLTSRQCLIWLKNSIVMGRQDYKWIHEPCLYGWKEGAAHLWASDRKQQTVLKFDRPTRNDIHPTMKPVDLLEYQIQNNTKGADLVLDLFGGSGSTMIACESLGRHARSMELDPRYVDAAVRRWQDFTGQEAVLVSSGRGFRELEAERLGLDDSEKQEPAPEEKPKRKKAPAKKRKPATEAS